MHLLTNLFNFFQRRDFLLITHRPNMGAREATAWYPDWIYETMETDEVRNREYRAVIEQTVKNKVVLELGTGRKALWALECARSGAKKVYAVEANPRSYESSVKIVRESGFPQIELLQGFSDRVELPELCEVLIHDLVGSIGSAEGMIPFLEDAKARLLKPGAIQIPSRCTTYFFPSALPAQTAGERVFNFVSRGCRRIRSMPMLLMFGHRPESMLAEPQVFEDLRLDGVLSSTSTAAAEFRIQRDGAWDALVFFIKLFVDERHVIDSLASRTNWYLPYVRPFRTPVPVLRDDIIQIETSTAHVNATPHYRIVCRHERCGVFTEVANHSWSGV